MIQHLKLPSNTALVIIDVQQGLDEPSLGPRCNLKAEQYMVRLLEVWRKQGHPVIHIQHLSTDPDSPLRPELPGCNFKAEVMPKEGERIFQKRVNSAFIGTGLEAYLNEQGLNTLVLIGLTTNQCVSTTARMAGNLGFETYVVSDATAAFDLIDQHGQHFKAEDVHAISLASLHEEFATVLNTKELLELI